MPTAPADGTVVAAVDGVPENTPRVETDRYHTGGNEVVLDLGQGEYAFLAHLIPGSARVKVGDAVKRGQAVGKVGNSGNSSEPHLHFQRSDHPRLFKARALPARFPLVTVNGKKVDLAWPTEGDWVR